MVLGPKEDNSTAYNWPATEADQLGRTMVQPTRPQGWEGLIPEHKCSMKDLNHREKGKYKQKNWMRLKTEQIFPQRFLWDLMDTRHWI